MTLDSTSLTTVDVRKGTYRDSVALMRVSREVAAVDGVEAALVAMATELNLELLAGMGATVPPGTGPDDLVIAVRAVDAASRDTALSTAEAQLAAMSTGGGGTSAEAPPRTVRTAAQHAAADGHPATLALVSVPGRYAAAEAFDALEAGVDVMVFSDNVPLEHEVALKKAADRLGRLVMGPDCGTAVIGGAGLGFANALRPGPVGIVAASGTGAQQVMCLLDAAGIGVSHCLGVGGRDLSAEVAGRSTLRALRMLDADPATERIVLISKPPAPKVAEAIQAEAAGLATPVHTALLGTEGPDLSEAAAEVIAALGDSVPAWPHWFPEERPAPRAGALRGLFCGGTLADEATRIIERTLGPVASNTPAGSGGAQVLSDSPQTGHLVIDFGDDTFTAGRPHPMIDPAAREERLAAELADPDTAVVLLDVVLGHGAHPDPAAGVAEQLRAARTAGSTTPVVVTLCGTENDPQGLAAQAETLRRAGAEVFSSNAEAARRAASLAGPAA
ncbi:MAG: FdrA family protein [Nocardiopsaceae bacterium]|nr:FdrA family protein [Nocardiopsaceae bacterium]